jgi:hypothetical protein
VSSKQPRRWTGAATSSWAGSLAARCRSGARRTRAWAARPTATWSSTRARGRRLGAHARGLGHRRGRGGRRGRYRQRARGRAVHGHRHHRRAVAHQRRGRGRLRAQVLEQRGCAVGAALWRGQERRGQRRGRRLPGQRAGDGLLRRRHRFRRRAARAVHGAGPGRLRAQALGQRAARVVAGVLQRRDRVRLRPGGGAQRRRGGDGELRRAGGLRHRAIAHARAERRVRHLSHDRRRDAVGAAGGGHADRPGHGGGRGRSGTSR